MTQIDYRNRVLRLLGEHPQAAKAIYPHLEELALKDRFTLEAPGRQIEHVYFVEEGVASVVAVGSADKRIEVGLIGREGVSGVAVLMGDQRGPYHTYMQISGRGYRCPTEILRKAVEADRELHNLFLRFAQAFLIQTAHTALANGRAKLEERLARWVLMAHDRLDYDNIPLTHEFLALMLGVRRAGVTVALHAFEKRGLIAAKRGQITLLDRKGIEEIAGSYYGVPEAEYARLLG